MNNVTHKFLSMYLFLFLTLYVFRAHRAHHQERQIVSIQPLVTVTLCWWPCRVQVGSELPTCTRPAHTSPDTKISVLISTRSFMAQAVNPQPLITHLIAWYCMWRTKWHRDRVFSQYFGFPLSLSFQHCSVIIHSVITDATLKVSLKTRFANLDPVTQRKLKYYAVNKCCNFLFKVPSFSMVTYHGCHICLVMIKD